MTLSHLPQEPAAPDQATVAFLTPKRLGPATVRNRLRRRMREIYRRKLQQPGETRYLVWIARPPAVGLDSSQLDNVMHDLHARLEQTP